MNRNDYCNPVIVRNDSKPVEWDGCRPGMRIQNLPMLRSDLDILLPDWKAKNSVWDVEVNPVDDETWNIIKNRPHMR